MGARSEAGVYEVECPRCGGFRLTDAATDALRERTDLHILSGVLREASDRGESTLVHEDHIEGLVASARIPQGPLAAADRLLEKLSNRASQFSSPIPLEPEDDFPLVFGKDADDLAYLLAYLGEAGLLELERYGHNPYRITLQGWQHLERLRQTTPQAAQAFVAMWFGDSMREVWDTGFRAGLVDAGYVPVRIDEVAHNAKICDRILAEIRRSGLVVADFTGGRGGVYFEAGFAMGLGIPVIWTCRADDIDGLHFDTQQYNHVVWTSADDLRLKLADRIVATLGPGPEYVSPVP